MRQTRLQRLRKPVFSAEYKKAPQANLQGFFNA